MKSSIFHKWIKLLSALLITSFLLESTPVVIASNSISQGKNVEENELIKSDRERAISFSLADNGHLEAVSTEEIQKRGHIQRLGNQEKDMNTIVFLNNDGTKSLYYFAEPVKYITEDGSIRDKCTSLAEVTDNSHKDHYKYVNADNNVRTYFPDSLLGNVGILFEADDISIELLPIPSAHFVDSTTAKIIQLEESTCLSNEAVSYEGVFTRDSELRYTPLLNGFKEDIIISSYSGVNEFTFSVKTNGLCIAENSGLLYLADPKTKDPIISIGDLNIYDSSQESAVDVAGRNYNHHFHVETIKSNDEYNITIVVDKSFLTSDDTVYPITIDPSFDIVSTNNGIMDIYVNQSGVIAKNNYLYAGESDSNQTVYRSFIKFPGLLESWKWIALAPPGCGDYEFPAITEFSLSLYNVGIGYTDADVKTYLYNGVNAVDWDYTSPTSFSNANFNAKDVLASSTSIDITSGWYTIDLTAISAFDLDKGIVIQNQYESQYNEAVLKCFHSTRNTNKPRITVTWRDLNQTSFETAKTISLNTSYYAPLLSENTRYFYSFTPSTTGLYTFKSSNIISGDPCGWLYNSEQSLLAYNDNSDGRNFCIAYHLDAGKKYYFVLGCYNGGTGRYTFNITSNTSIDNISFQSMIAINSPKTINISTTRERKFFSFTAPSSGRYIFESSGNGSSDPYGWIYYSNATIVGSNDDGGTGRNFQIICDLAAGQKVCLVGGCYGTGTGQFSVTVTQIVITKEISQNLNVGDYLSIPIAESNVDNSNSTAFSISFNPDDFELISAYGLSPYPILNTGIVAGSNINITSISASEVSFTFNPSTAVESRIVNIILLRAKQTGTLSVICSAHGA